MNAPPALNCPASPLEDPALRAKVAGSSFYAGMRVLPVAEREAMFAIYAFCRIVDDIADDEGADVATRAAALDRWRGDLAALYAGKPAGQADFLRDAVARFGLQQADFVAVIDGMAMDVAGPVQWPDYPTLDLYCDRVASAVGRLSVRVFGMDEVPGLALAHHLGRALQLTNILRDIDEDAAIGRVYLPREALAAAGIDPTTPAALVADPRLDAAAHWLVPHAQTHFTEADGILAAKPRGLLTAPRLMQSAYARVLGRMTRRGWAAPRVRVGVNKPLLALSLLRHLLLG
ncbi:MAG: presqualene diphosphate synthase HpnD [Sphingomonadales bacterium]|nr:presqualene diphosphate synthase HpnD [Sphingomonadales bacterium]